ncbi:MAG: protein kinase domain-containing protein [Thermoguttaceae bacterium]
MPSSSADHVPQGPTGPQPEPGATSPPAPQDPEATVISDRPPISLTGLASAGVSPGPERKVPFRLGQFELQQYVGGGGMGRVFRACDTALGRTVAIKVLSRQQAADPELVARFRNEAQSAARLNHENIAQVYHVGEEDGLPYIVFEYIDGVNLRTLIEQKGPLPLADALSYTFQVAQALAHAAARNVVHRDIKPSNVLITGEGRVKLIDMGLARLQSPPGPGGDLTASGVTLGTFDYIAPEQARDPRTADVRSDIYSLGCTLFFMLTGRPPFPEGTALQKLLQHQEEKPPDVRQFRPDLPEQVSQLLRRMMAKEPRRRFKSPAELIEELVALAEQAGLTPAGPGYRSWVVPRRPKMAAFQRHVPWVVPLALLIAMVWLLRWVGPSPSEPVRTGAVWIGTPEELVAMPPEPSPGPSAEKSDSKAPAEAPQVHLAAKTPEKPPSPPGHPSGTPGEQPTKAGSSPVAPQPIAASPGPPDRQDAAPRTAWPGGQISSTPAAGLRPETTQGGLRFSDGSVGGVLSGSQPGADQGELTGALGAGSPSALPAGPGLPEPPATSPPGVLIVDGVGGGTNRFATLEAACAAAANHDVIELRYHGPRLERPIALNNLRLTIRPGKGFRPLLVFRPGQLDPLKYPRAMFSLTSSHLSLVDLGVELGIPRDVQAESWSLFELRQAEARLDRCALTICNAAQSSGAYHQDTAFFRIRAPPGSDTAGAESLARPPVNLTLTDCVVRGEAVVVRVQHLRPLRISWNNGLLVTSERFLVADGSDEAPLAGEPLSVSLQHLTAVVRSGLCRLVQSQSAPRQAAVELSVANSILIGSPTGPLIEQIGVPEGDPYRERIVWNGDRNFYEGFRAFWSVRFADPKTPAVALDFEAWRAYWGDQQEIVPSVDQVQWEGLPGADRALYGHEPADYALRGSSATGPTNPALGAASDGRDAGLEAELLPPVPPPCAEIPVSPPIEGASPEAARPMP